MPTVTDLCHDLADEQESLDLVLDTLGTEDWRAPTPAAGWDVLDSVSHLCFFEEAAALALSDPAAFEAQKQRLLDDMAAGKALDVGLGRSLGDPRELLERWRRARSTFSGAAAAVDPASRVPWYGPGMSPASFTTARIMEAWAHGVDIRDALGVPLVATPRLRHVCHIGYGARAYSFAVHKIADPGDPVRLSVGAPGGGEWSWGPEGAAERISGSALDVALVFAQRRHHSRTDVDAEGPVAALWLSIAQAFAGPATVTDPER